MRARSPDPHGDLDVSTLPAVLRRKAGVLVPLALMVGGLTYGALLMVPSRYRSEAQIQIGAPGLSSASRGAASAETVALSVDREAIAGRVQELRSPDLAKKLAAELRLATRPEFNSALRAPGLWNRLLARVGLGGARPGETEDERVLAAYYRALQVYQVKDTRVITLSFTARESDLAAQMANRLIELYQAWLRERGVTETTDVHAWLAPEIEKRTRELSVAEAAVERFRATANLYRGGGNQPGELAQQQLTELSSELTKVRAQRSEAEARARAARNLMQHGTPDAIPDVQKSPVIQGLIAQRVRAERDYAEASTQLLPAHPRMKQLAANVADVRRQIQREAATVVSGIEREADALAFREELQKRTLDEAKAGLGSKADDRVRLAQLEDDVKAKRQELEGLRQRFEASRSRGISQAVPIEVQVIATARPSSVPSWPNRLQIALLAAASTFVLGLVTVLFRELLAAGSRKPASMQVAREAASPAVAGQTGVPSQDVRQPATITASELTSRAGTAPPIGAAQPGPVTLGSVEAIAERLTRNASGGLGYRTLVAGEAAGADARVKAIDLAVALAQSGSAVVLVDWSLDGVGLSQILGEPPAPGFTDLLARGATLDNVIRPVPESSLHLIPCGTACPDGIASLDADRMNLVLDALDEAYAQIVITGAPHAARELFRMIEGRVDAGVLVHAGKIVSLPTAPATGSKFLGYDVVEIDIIHLDEATTKVPARNTPRRAARSGGLPAVSGVN